MELAPELVGIYTQNGADFEAESDPERSVIRSGIRGFFPTPRVGKFRSVFVTLYKKSTIA